MVRQTVHTPKSVIADEIFHKSVRWDLDDCGYGAAQEIIARLEQHGFVIVKQPGGMREND